MHTVKSDSISLSQNMNDHTGMPGYALVACTPVSLERHGLPAKCRSIEGCRLLVGVILPLDRWLDTSLHCSGGCYPPGHPAPHET